jgi:UDP-N-acetylglucosamine 1-carboxyvinyltransferase
MEMKGNALIIKGNRNLNGYLEVSGAKNSALPNIAATILTDEEVILKNIPYLLDIEFMNNLLTEIGSEIKELGNKNYSYKLNNPKSLTANYDFVSKMRASILVLGPMLSRFGYAEVSLPGGCCIGTRPIDLHIKSLEKMGAVIELEHGFIKATAVNGLKGAHIKFDKITVTGTENILMAAVLADGETVIENAALEPEVVDLALLLKKMGANIEGEGTPVIKIKGVKKLHGTEHTIIPDRIEAATFAILSAISEGNIVIKNYPKNYLEYVDFIFKKIGINVIDLGDNQVIVKRNKDLKPIKIETKEYPYFLYLYSFKFSTYIL